MKTKNKKLIRSAEDLDMYKNKLRKVAKLNYYEEDSKNDDLIQLQYETKATPFVFGSNLIPNFTNNQFEFQKPPYIELEKKKFVSKFTYDINELY